MGVTYFVHITNTDVASRTRNAVGLFLLAKEIQAIIRGKRTIKREYAELVLYSFKSCCK